MKMALRISQTMFFVLTLFTCNVFAQNITIIEPDGDDYCTLVQYMYVAQLDDATSFSWEVVNPTTSPQPTFNVSGAKSDTVFIRWHVPSFVQDVPNYNVIKVIAKKNDLAIDSVELIVNSVLAAPTPIPWQEINQASDTIACGDMTVAFSYAYPTSTQQEFSATIQPRTAGEVFIYKQWLPLQDPSVEVKIIWNKDFSGSAILNVETFNVCNSDSKEYYYFKDPSFQPIDSDYIISGKDSVCKFKSTYSITDSTDYFVGDVSIIPDNATDLVISRDSFYFINGNPVVVKFLDVYWNDDFTGTAQLILHSQVDCSASGSFNSYANIDTFDIFVCDELVSTILIEDKKINDLKIFPNPIYSGGTINFNADIECPATIEIVQISSGQVIYQGTISNSNCSFDVPSQIPTGLYMVRVRLGNRQQQFHSKLVVIE